MHFPTMHSTALHCTALQCTDKLSLTVYCMSMQYTVLHYMAFMYVTVNTSSLQLLTFPHFTSKIMDLGEGAGRLIFEIDG